MRDVVWTIIISWVVWKLWASFQRARTSATFHKEEHHHHHYSNSNEGETVVQNSSNNKEKKFRDNEGDYVDFEEIK